MSSYLRFFTAACLCAALWSAPALADHADCPDPGSGAAGVAAWAAEHCGEDAECGGASVTCNHEFSIELVDVVREGDHVTFVYKVCRLSFEPGGGLSHVVFGLGQLADCLGEDFDLSDLLVGCTVDGEEADCEFGLDPTTQVSGVKFEPVPDIEDVGECVEVSFTLDESKLEADQMLGTGCSLAATKAGNQDIRREDRESPGYACVEGPVCKDRDDEEGTGCTPGYWKTATPQAGDHSHWPEPHEPGDLVKDVFDIDQGDSADCISEAIQNATLLEALDFSGGPAVDGGARILLRAAVAALLNAQQSENGTCDADYPLSVQEVVDRVNEALDSCDRDTMTDLAEILDAFNNLGCPTDAHGECIVEDE